ncbi:hypothetical protein [Candidatus Symbiopectobacterium sp. 'North America']|uniref:hypothetical protein n=1 Tax=Candidatus Symbiopectobacterium sp. 'North America' TaxID=2794574 RepID=UPI001FD52254|nr:hypothetical protein [Candidatus Symbiopectobacterium sp. 'North America']
MGLGAAEKATLDLSGDGFLQVAVPSTSGVKEALIQNNGAVIMTAATARNAVRNAINLSGVVEANSVGGQNGAITIGETEVSGKSTLAYTGKTDLSADSGKYGNLLLDPHNVIISSAADTGSGFSASADDSVINTSTLQGALALR